MDMYTQRIDSSLKTLATPTDDTQNSILPSIALPFETRQKSRFKAALATGEAIGVDLPRTGVLRNGDIIATDDGKQLQVIAAPEQLMQVTAQNPFDLLKAAYHLGNRHVVLMVTPSALYFEPDHVLASMVEQLGLIVSQANHAFEPESGAYKHHHDMRLKPL